MRKSIKKMVALTVAATTVMASLVACTPSNNSGGGATAPAANDSGEPAEAEGLEVSGDSVSIRFNWWGGDSRHQQTLEALDLFMEKYPNIEVVAEYEAWSGHEEKIALAVNSGNVADVVQVNWGWVYDFSPNADKFYDMNKLSNIIDLDNFDDISKDALTVGGALQAVPISNTGRVFFWNKTTFEKVGVEIPTTLDELLAVGDAFAAYEDGSYYPMQVGEYDRMILMVYYLESIYGKNWVEDGVLQYSLEEVTEGMEFIQSLDDHHVTPTIADIAGDGADTLDKNQKWMDGKYAGIYEWDSSAEKFEAALEGDQEFIVGDFIKMGDYQGGFTKISMGYAINANTAYAAECATLIDFLLTDEEAVKILGDSRGIPANAAGLAILGDDLEGNMVSEANKAVMEWSQFSLDPKFENATLKNNDGAYYLAMQMLSSGQDAASCADYLVKAIETELAK